MKKTSMFLVLSTAVILAGTAQAADIETLKANAAAAMKAANYESAAASYQQAEQAAPSKKGKSDFANSSGYALLKARKYGEAVQAFTRATQVNPANKLAWKNLGLTHFTIYTAGLSGTEALESAIAASTKATELEPAYASSTNYKSENLKLALSAMEQENRWAAAAAARSGKPAVTDCADYKSCREAGDKAEDEGDFAAAKALYEKAEASAPSKKGKAVCANILGHMALKARNPQMAVDSLRRATMLDPASKLFWNNLGNALGLLYESGQGGKELVEESVGAFKKVSAIDPTYKAENLASAEQLLTELGGPTVSATTAVESAPATKPAPEAPPAPAAKPAPEAPAAPAGK